MFLTAVTKTDDKKVNKPVPSYLLHIAIAFSDPLIWRRIQVPGEYTLEEVVPPTRELKHPIIMAGERACPPETVGDIHEYQELLAARETPDSKNRNRLDELVGRPDFDPALFDLEAAKKQVGALR